MFNFFIYEKINILNKEYGMNINPKDYDLFNVLSKYFNIDQNILSSTTLLIFYLTIFGIIIGYLYHKADIFKKK